MTVTLGLEVQPIQEFLANAGRQPAGALLERGLEISLLRRVRGVA